MEDRLIETAKQIEELTNTVLELNEGTGLIPKTFVSAFRVVRKNTVKNAYQMLDEQADASKKGRKS